MVIVKGVTKYQMLIQPYHYLSLPYHFSCNSDQRFARDKVVIKLFKGKLARIERFEEFLITFRLF